MTTYYNELDPFAAQWIRNLCAKGLVTDGIVDDRSIKDVKPADVAGHTRAHFFAGIALWDLALQWAGWPADVPVWTGSCPCQPFSTAGEQKGFDDDRHLWPVWFPLIRECRPAIIFGEQVARGDEPLEWLDLVFSDLEGEGYACGASHLCAAAVGAPHERERLYWVAHTEGFRLRQGNKNNVRGDAGGVAQQGTGPSRCGSNGQLGDTAGNRWRQGGLLTGETDSERSPTGLGDSGALVGPGPGGVEDASGERCEGERLRVCERGPQQAGAEVGGRGTVDWMGSPIRQGSGRYAGGDDGAEAAQQSEREQPRGFGHRFESSGMLGGPWSDADWIFCRPEPRFPQGSFRPVEPGAFPLAHGYPQRVGRVRAYGNAIAPTLAATFIKAVIDVLTHPT